MTILGPWVDPKILAGGFNFSPVLNLATLTYGADVLDKSTFGQATKIHMAGLRNIALEASGFAEIGADLQDAQNFANIGLSNIPVSIFPNSTPVLGDPAYFFQAAQAKYNLGGQHGQMLPFSFDAHGASGHPLLRGVILDPGTEYAGPAHTTSGVNIGAVSASQYLYSVVHVTQCKAGGGTLNYVRFDSDDNSGFTTATQQFQTSPAVTSTPTGFYLTRVAGPITDNWWHLVIDITGGTGTYKIFAAICIA